MDLRDQAYDKSGCVSQKEGLEIAEHFRCQFSECSALTREGLGETFERGVRLALRAKNKEEKVGRKSESSCAGCDLM